MDQRFIDALMEKQGSNLWRMKTVAKECGVAWWELHTKLIVRRHAIYWNCKCCNIQFDKYGRTDKCAKQQLLDKVFRIHRAMLRVDAFNTQDFGRHSGVQACSSLTRPLRLPTYTARIPVLTAPLVPTALPAAAGFATTDDLWDGYSKWKAVVTPYKEYGEGQVFPWRATMHADLKDLICFPRAVACTMRERRKAQVLKQLVEKVDFTDTPAQKGVTVAQAMEYLRDMEVAVLYYNEDLDEVLIGEQHKDAKFGVLFVPGNNDTFAPQSHKKPIGHWLPVLTAGVTKQKMYWKQSQTDKKVEGKKVAPKGPFVDVPANLFDVLDDEVPSYTDADSDSDAELLETVKALSLVANLGKSKYTIKAKKVKQEQASSSCSVGVDVGTEVPIFPPPPPPPRPPHPAYVTVQVLDDGWRKVYDPQSGRLRWVEKRTADIRVLRDWVVDDFDVIDSTALPSAHGLRPEALRALELELSCSVDHLLWQHSVSLNALVIGLQPGPAHGIHQWYNESLDDLLALEAEEWDVLGRLAWEETNRFLYQFIIGQNEKKRNAYPAPLAPRQQHHAEALIALGSTMPTPLPGLELCRRAMAKSRLEPWLYWPGVVPYCPKATICLARPKPGLARWSLAPLELHYKVSDLPGPYYIDATDYAIGPLPTPTTNYLGSLTAAFCAGPTVPPVRCNDDWFPTVWNPIKTNPTESHSEVLVAYDRGSSLLSMAIRTALGKPTLQLYQLHPGVLKAGVAIPEAAMIYCRMDQTALDDRFLCDGSYNHSLIEYIRCSTGNLALTDQKTIVHDGRRYCLWSLTPVASKRWRVIRRALLPKWLLGTVMVEGIHFRTRPVEPLLLSRIVGPTGDAKYRTAYTLITPELPVRIQAPFHDNRNEEMSLEDRSGTEPYDIAQNLTRCLQDAEKLYPKEAGFAVRRRTHPVQCVSCCKNPPKKYRWRHRVCEDCENKLLHGAITWAGAQVVAEDSVGRVPSCAPGICKKMNRQYPPAVKKWESVDTTSGGASVKFSKESVLQGRSRKAVRKYTDFEKRDLEALKAYGTTNKRQLAFVGVGCSGCSPMLSAKTTYNQAKALCGRAFRTPKVAEPEEGIFEWLDQFVPVLLPAFEAKSLTFDAWLQTMPTRRRKPLSDAHVEYLRTGWQKKFEEFTAFVKQEKLPDFSKDDFGITKMVEMLDRLIQGPNDVTHTIAGPILKPLIQRLHEIWDDQNCLFYGSVGPEALHKWLQRLVVKAGVYIWCDYSMYDNTHSKASWAFMERLYRRSAVDAPDFWKVMDAWRQPRGRIGPFKYKARVMNASGRDDTALANGVLNGFAAYLSACAAWLDIPLRSLTPQMVEGCKAIIIMSVCGDDSLGSIPDCTQVRREKFCRDMAHNISLFGFEAKLQASTKLYDAVYLGQRPYPTKAGWFWGKTIGRSTYKMGWIIDDKQDLLAHLTGIAEMHVLCSAHVPVLADIAQTIVRLRTGAKRTPVQLDPNRPWEWTYKSGVPYDDLTLEAVVSIYNCRRTPTTGEMNVFDTGVTIEEVRALIAEIQGIEQLPYIIRSPLWERMIWVDDL